MSRGLLIASVACVVCACMPVTPSLAASDARDAAATRAYLRAGDAYSREASALLGARVAALEARASEIAAECPLALTYAPRDESFGDISGEILTVAGYAGAAPVRPLLLRESRAIGRLRWSNSRLTRLVRLQAAEELGVVTIALPDPCADIAAWRASAYAVLPKSVGGFLARTEAIEAELFVGPSEELREKVIMRLLGPYESSAERRIAKRVERLETKAGKRISSAMSAARARLEGALGASVL